MNATRARERLDETRVLRLAESSNVQALKEGGAQTLLLEGGGSMQLDLGTAYWLSTSKPSKESDVEAQLAFAIPAADGEVYGVVDAVNNNADKGMPRSVLIMRMARRVGDKPELITVLKPGITAATGSQEENWHLGLRLTGDTPSGIDKVTVSYEGEIPLEVIGALDEEVEARDPLPREVWAPTATELRQALQIPQVAQ